MNKQEIKENYKSQKAILKAKYKADRDRLKLSRHRKKKELKFKSKSAPKEERAAIKEQLRAEKNAYKKEVFLQKSIYQEALIPLKREKRTALGGLVTSVTAHAPESLAGGLTLSYVLIFFVLALVQGGFIIGATYYSVERRAEDALITTASALQASGLSQEAAERLADETDFHVALYREDQTLIYAYGAAGLEETLPYNERLNEAFSYRNQSEKVKIYSKKVTTPEGTFYLNLAKGMESEDATVSLVVNLTLFSGVAAMIISYLVGHRIAKKKLRPIGVLGRAMEEMSAAKLSDRLDTRHIRTELVEVVESYNSMLDKIEEAYSRQKQFVSDASHELRTPLAVIAGYSDILSRWGMEDPAVRQEAVEAILSQTQNMQALLERLLYIARSENGKVQASFAQTALAPLCEELLQDFRMMHPNRSFSLQGAASAWCDANLMRQLLTILLDNAAKFTQEGGKIEIALSQEEGQTCISVSDNGIGMSQAVQERVFERFYKGDSSHNEKGFGLGLSIARLIAESQNATLSVESEEGKGSTFTVTLIPREN